MFHKIWYIYITETQYIEVRVTGRQKEAYSEPEELQAGIDRFFARNAAWNTAHPEEQRIPLIEELFHFLGISRGRWESLREAEKGRKSRELAEVAQKAEQRFTAAILQAAFANPRLITLAVYLTKQKWYGAYADRQTGPGSKPQQTLTVRLEGASEPFD